MGNNLSDHKPYDFNLWGHFIKGLEYMEYLTAMFKNPQDNFFGILDHLTITTYHIHQAPALLQIYIIDPGKSTAF